MGIFTPDDAVGDITGSPDIRSNLVCMRNAVKLFDLSQYAYSCHNGKFSGESPPPPPDSAQVSGGNDEVQYNRTMLTTYY